MKEEDFNNTLKERKATEHSVLVDNSKFHSFTKLIRCGTCGHPYIFKRGQYKTFYACITFEKKGKQYCQSRRIREDILIKNANEVMDYKEFNEIDLRSKVDFIEAFNGNRLVYHFKDGTIKEAIWQDPKRSEGWTAEMREKARQSAKKQNKKKDEKGRWMKQ